MNTYAAIYLFIQIKQHFRSVIYFREVLYIDENKIKLMNVNEELIKSVKFLNDDLSKYIVSNICCIIVWGSFF
jgi:predicted phosphatase